MLCIIHYIYFFVCERKIRAKIKPNMIAAAIPPAVEVKQPEKTKNQQATEQNRTI